MICKSYVHQRGSLVTLSISGHTQDQKKMIKLRPSFGEGSSLGSWMIDNGTKLLTSCLFESAKLIVVVQTSLQGKPMQQLISATSRAIKYKAQAACPLGMVKFSDSSVILAPLTNLTDTTRNDLLNKIPKSAAGHTAIGQGLLSALEASLGGVEP